MAITSAQPACRDSADMMACTTCLCVYTLQTQRCSRQQ